uniref:rRNA biogenesis protein RRP36 n=1 Tax=Mola mola TaxID=94237 RepID=A0A3Q3XEW6_MOLML
MGWGLKSGPTPSCDSSSLSPQLLSFDTPMKGIRRQPQQAASSSADEDSDVEKKFAPLSEGGGRGGGAEEEEEELGDGGDEDEEEGSGDSEAPGDNDQDSEIAGGSSEVQTREDIKKELSNMSFEDVLKLQNKVGTRVYNQVAFGGDKSGQTHVKKKRLNKNRPTEVSAKNPAPFLRQVVATLRDPRFDDLSGEYKAEIFENTYKFISDIKLREREVRGKQLKRAKSDRKKEKLQFLLTRMDNQERARQSREQQRERELQFKRQQRERANQGAAPFFLKKSDRKKLQLAGKYEQLKKSGKLENFLSKKRRRNAVKDRRKLPRQRKSR